jgi:tol-pal system protein YbgF
MTRSRIRIAPLAALTLSLLAASAAGAQERSNDFLGGIFNSNRNNDQQQQQQQQDAPPQAGPSDSGGDATRIDRLENALRQLTGSLEQLQYQNQQMQMQLKRLQDDTEYRFQQLGSKGGLPPAAANGPRPMSTMAPQAPQALPNVAPPAVPADSAQAGRRSDAFDPSRTPNAPGAPRTLGNASVMAPPADNVSNAPPVGVPGGRDAGAPLDLSTLAANPGNPPPAAQAGQQPVAGGQMAPVQMPPANNGGAAPNVQLATLPPSASPQDEYDMAYGYVLHKDYPLAEQAFRDFLRKHPNEKQVADAQYWLGESLFQTQRYRDAAESFLTVSTKYGASGKAPDSLLRLGQSLAALSQREAACATLAEVGRKYPHATPSVKRGVTLEQKREHC